MTQQCIWTIGHSTHSLEAFLSMLGAFEIELVADIRRFPASRRFPHFNQAALQVALHEHAIKYRHLPGLGGRRNPRVDSSNTGWRVAAFRGYADYMETESFEDAIQELQLIASTARTAYLCSEAVWWRCHRSLVSDYLKFQGWKVMHIMATGKAGEHPYTKPAIVHGDKLIYPSKEEE